MQSYIITTLLVNYPSFVLIVVIIVHVLFEYYLIVCLLLMLQLVITSHARLEAMEQKGG